MTRWFSSPALLLPLTLCGVAQVQADTLLPAAEERLDVIALPGYMERGQSDPRYEWVTRFERSTGCQVVPRTVDSPDAMLHAQRRGNVDVMVVSSETGQRFIQAGIVSPLNAAWLQAPQKNLHHYFTHHESVMREGTRYGLPLLWGINALLYNQKVFPTPPPSWSVLFDMQNLPDGKTNAGRIQAYDSPIAMADAALYLMKTQPALGIQNPFELNAQQYTEVLILVLRQRPLLSRYWHDPTRQISDLRNKGTVATRGRLATGQGLRAEGRGFAITIPKEGATAWLDSMMVHKRAKHLGCAYRWMAYATTPPVQAALSEWRGGNPVVPTACQASAPAGTDFCKQNGYTQLEKLYFWKLPQLHCKTQSRCVPYSVWMHDYMAILLGMG